MNKQGALFEPETAERVSGSRDSIAVRPRVTFIDSLTEPNDLARQLIAVFGAPMTSRLAGYKDPKIAYRWSHTNGSLPAEAALRRLYAAFRIWSEVREERTHSQAIAWFIASHPKLDGQQPLDLMSQGRFAEVSEVTRFNNLSPAAQLRAAESEIALVTGLWHDASLRPLLEVVRALAERFGAPTVALIAGGTNPKAAYRWVKNEGRLPLGAGAQCLYDVYRAAIALDEVFPAPVARAWFFAANRALGERSPIEVAREGRSQELLRAADQLLFSLNQIRKTA